MSWPFGFGKSKQEPGEKQTATITEEQEQAIKERAVQEFIAAGDTETKPIRGGRSSVNESQGNLLPNANSPISTDYPFYLLKILENLSIYNRHVSYAVDNIVSLANTPMDIYFADTVSDAETKAMKQHLKVVESQWYEFSEGRNSLTNDMLTQIAINGAVSVESVIKKNLSGIKKVVRVSPYAIRFAYDDKLEVHVPLQEWSGNINAQSKYPGFVELNPRTYIYMANRRYNNSPYPVPPFVAAMEDLLTESDMIGGFKNVMKRMGMMGFLSVLLTAPQPKQGESTDDYQQRLIQYLEVHRPHVEQGFSKGMTMGFKGAHEFKLEGTNMNAGGGETLMKMVKSLVFAGLKQDPNMLGENYATTETFGRVILAKMTKQIDNYQKIVASVWEKLYFRELTLAGFNPGYVECVFQAPMTGDRKRDMETEEINIRNVNAKYDSGVISQLQRAQELGYDQPAEDAPRVPDEPSPAVVAPAPVKPAAKEKETELKKPNVRMDYGFLLGNAEYQLGKFSPVKFDYTVPAECIPDNFLQFADNTDFGDKALNRFAKRYLKAVNKSFKEATKQCLPGLRAALEKMDESTRKEEFTDAVMFHLYRDWKQNFNDKVKPVVDEIVAESYRHFRSDKSIFTQAKGFNKGGSFIEVPDSVFGLLDYRAIEYLQRLDNLYLGKFITDDDTRRRVKEWIEEMYLSDNRPIGKDEQAIESFLEEFNDQVNLEAYKIRRIVETSVNKIRNYANVNYIDQAELEQFEVMEVLDSKTCKWCRHMDGKVFSVKQEVEKIKNLVDGKPEDVEKLSPFATKYKVDEFTTMDAAQLQAKGIASPGYHPHCRGRLTAVI